jgi:hypothetical protein
LGWKPLQIITNVSASVGSVMQPAGFDNARACCRRPTPRTAPIRNGIATPT